MPSYKDKVGRLHVSSGLSHILHADLLQYIPRIRRIRVLLAMGALMSMLRYHTLSNHWLNCLHQLMLAEQHALCCKYRRL